MTSGLHRHLDPDPVCLQNAERPRTHSMPRQDIKTAVRVQGVVGILQVEEYVIEDRLPHGYELMKQLCLKVGGPCSSPLPSLA